MPKKVLSEAEGFRKDQFKHHWELLLYIKNEQTIGKRLLTCISINSIGYLLPPTSISTGNSPIRLRQLEQIT